MDDLCTPAGAARIKEHIEAYWKERGYDVTVTTHDAGFAPAMRSARTDVRSDMIGGWPVRRAT